MLCRKVPGVKLPIAPGGCRNPCAAQDIRYYHDDRNMHAVLPLAPDVFSKRHISAIRRFYRALGNPRQHVISSISCNLVMFATDPDFNEIAYTRVGAIILTKVQYARKNRLAWLKNNCLGEG